MKFTSLKMDISNNVRKMKDSLDQSISSALPSTMFTNGMVENISVSMRISASSLRTQRSVSRNSKMM
jgi:hypothetical protein